MNKAFAVFLIVICGLVSGWAQNTNLTTVHLELRLMEVVGVENRAVGFDWYTGNALAHGGGKGVAAVNPAPGSEGPRAAGIGTISGIMTDEQFRTVVRALEGREGAKVLASPRGTTLSGRALKVQRPDGWQIEVVPTVQSGGAQIEMEVTLKQEKGEYAGFALSTSTQVRPGESAVFGDTFEAKEKKESRKNLMLWVTPKIESGD